MKKKIIAGNWKMNKTFQEAEELISDLLNHLEEYSPEDDKEILICPPSPYLELATDLAQGRILKVGAQNVNANDFGAYTGEISAPMLKSMEVNYCIVGHSERRKYYHETDDSVADKINALLKEGIIAVYCCGETLEERESGKQFDVVGKQIGKALSHLSSEQLKQIVVAYEPVWAIGTGKNASPEQAQEMHAYIRKQISGKFGKDAAEELSILYGGSCNSKNAKSLFSNPDVDGGLIGGASLDADEFFKIVKSMD